MNRLKIYSTKTLGVHSLAGNDGEAQVAEPQVAESSLPSDVAEAKGWDAVKEKGLIPDELINDPEALANKFNGYKKFMDEYNANKSQATDQAAKEVEASEAIEAQKEGLISMLPEFLDGGMELTPDIEAKAAELGVDIRDLKLGAIDLRDRMTKAYSIAGDKETYDTMINEMADVMTDTQKKSFNKDVTTDVSEFAIRGLHAAWLESKGGTGVQKDRIKGSVPTGTGTKGYDNKAEMLKDATYLKTRGKKDLAARQKYQDRLAKTPDKVIYGR